MQGNKTPSNQDLRQNGKKGSKAHLKWLWGGIGVLIVCVVLFFAIQFFSGRMPVSTLRVKEFPTFESLVEACGNSTDQWSLSLQNPNRKFPAYSPDGEWYITVGSATYRDAEELRLYDTGSNRIVGTYSFYHLSLACWAKDSSGVYLQDWVPGGPFDFLVSTRYSPPKEILVPTLSR